ncbi:MAG: metal ABC transporter substrate-binding protein [Anaerolineae bacterium]
MRHSAVYKLISTFMISVLLVVALSSCTTQPSSPPTVNIPRVLAAETFLADIAQNVAGNRLKVESLIPLGVDPHAFEPTPRDVVKIAESDLMIINGAGIEDGWLDKLIATSAVKAVVVIASEGLSPRTPSVMEIVDEEFDPHFWLDPNQVITYVTNIRDALIAADAAGSEVYTANAAAYIIRLQQLDSYIREKVATIPPERRLLVTNHESFGYFADRYGLTIIGTIIPSVSTGSSPSAQQLAQLVDLIVANNAIAIFLETDTNEQLANQLARETGIKVVTGLYTHSITEADGNAPTYIDMIKYNVQAIVTALN